jgi:hypothetical protein
MDGEKRKDTVFEFVKIAKQLTKRKLCVIFTNSSEKTGSFLSVKLHGHEYAI